MVERGNKRISERERANSVSIVVYQVSIMNDHNISSNKCTQRFSHGSSWNEVGVPPRCQPVNHHNLDISKQAPMLPKRKTAYVAVMGWFGSYSACHGANQVHYRRTCIPSSSMATPILRGSRLLCVQKV
jgi:hypothetical protein